MNLGIDGRTAIVTGASKGIGKSIAEGLLREGANVALVARTADDLDAAAAEFASLSGQAYPVQADVTEDDDVVAMVERTRERFGGPDILVNNAGILGSDDRFDEVPLEVWRHVFEVNVFGIVRSTKAALPRMREQGWGRIVNIASEAGLQPDEYKPQYDASKAAVINLTKHLSKAYSKEGVLVNAVSPATSNTPLVTELFERRAAAEGKPIEQCREEFIEREKPGMVQGLQRLGEPHEVADVAVFLCSERASWVTGANYRVDGGSIYVMDP